MKTAKNHSTFSEKARRLLAFFLKVAFAAAIIIYLVGKNAAAVAEGFRAFQYWWLLPAALLYLSHMIVCAYRWFVLTRVLNIRLSWPEALSLTMQAYFFSLVVPGGAIGGDVVKIGVLSTRSPAGSKVEGAFTILMDRIVGMIALFLTAIVVTIPAIPILMQVTIPGVPLDHTVKILGIAAIFLLCVTGLAASGAIFFHRTLEKIPPVGKLMQWADRLSHGMVRRLTDAADAYSRAWKITAQTVLWSIPLVHLMTVAVFACLAAGAGADGAGVLTLIAAVTIGNIVGLIPLFPSGVGARDVAAITILVAGGMAVGDAKTAQLLYTALVIGFSLFGGLFFIFDPGKKRSRELLHRPEESSDTEEPHHE